jgi:hypothetical protein
MKSEGKENKKERRRECKTGKREGNRFNLSKKKGSYCDR